MSLLEDSTFDGAGGLEHVCSNIETYEVVLGPPIPSYFLLGIWKL